jgi:hypothetical protein
VKVIMPKRHFQTRTMLAHTLLLVSLGACTLGPDGVSGFDDGGGPPSAGTDDDDDDGSSGASDGADGAGGSSGDPGDDSPDPVDESSGGATSDAPPDEPPGPGPSGEDIGECSSFASVEQFFAFVNDERAQYTDHPRWKGLPWQGEGHDQFTFSPTFTWDDQLAAQAQAEAEALAGGASPSGNQQNGSNGLPICAMSPLWIDGLNTASWRISLGETVADWNPPPSGSCPPTTFALSPQNQHARMGLHYHDFGGDGPAIQRLGVGVAVEPVDAAGECKVWWVLQFGA